MTEITTLKKQRALIHKVVSSIAPNDLIAIPAFRSNNIAWNLGHIVTVQQTLTYGLSGLPLNLPENYRAWYFRDTSPANWSGEPDVARLLEELLRLPELIEQDYAEGKFANFQPYTTVTGVSLNTVEEAMGFNNFHEGIHLGIIFSIRKELASVR